MTKETKIRLLQIILNAGIKGTDREMLDNLKAVIKAIEGEEVKENPYKNMEKGPVIVTNENDVGPIKVDPVLPPLKKKPGRPPKKR